MKYGIRTPSVKRSISARTTGKIKRTIKSSVNPAYGKKGMGTVNSPKKAIYNNVYNKTTVSPLNKSSQRSSYSTKNANTSTKNNSNVEVNYNIYINNNHNYTTEQQKALFIRNLSFSAWRIHDNNDEYPRCMYYDYEISNPKIFHKNMIYEGYFIPANFYETIKDYRKAELCEIAETEDINIQKLKKDDIVLKLNNVLSNAKKEEIMQHDKRYVISDKGKKVLNDNEAFLLLHDNSEWKISLEEFNEYKNKLPKYLKFNDIIWNIFNDRYIKCDFSQRRTIDLHRAKFLENESKGTESLYHYILVLYYDVNLDSFQKTIFNYKKYKYEKETLIDSFEADIHNFIALGIIEKIKKLGTNYKNETIDRIYKTPRLPYNFIDKKEFQQMIEEIISLDVLNTKKYEKIIKTNVEKLIDTI